MSRSSSRSFALSLLPLIAIPGVLSIARPQQSVPAADPENGGMVLYQAPSPQTDPLRVRQLVRLRHEIAACEDLPQRSVKSDMLHPNLSAEYQLIVRETTPEALRHAGLPADVR